MDKCWAGVGGGFFLKFWKSFLKGPQVGNHCYIYSFILIHFGPHLPFLWPFRKLFDFPQFICSHLSTSPPTWSMSAASLRLTMNIDFQIPCKNANNLFSPPGCAHSFGPHHPSAWTRAQLPTLSSGHSPKGGEQIESMVSEEKKIKSPIYITLSERRKTIFIKYLVFIDKEYMYILY